MSSATAGLITSVEVEGRMSRRDIVAAVLRVLGVVTGTLLLYALVPIDGTSAARRAFIVGILGITAILIVFARQMSRVSRAKRPVLAAVEALALVFGLFVCFFALMYVSVSEGDPTAFSAEVDKLGGVYFAMTIITTVGFGDIVAVSDAARVIVTVQMVLGAVLIATAVKALAFTAREAVKARHPVSAGGAGSGSSASAQSPAPAPAPDGSSGSGSTAAEG